MVVVPQVVVHVSGKVRPRSEDMPMTMLVSC